MNGLHGRRGGQARRPVDRSIIVIIGCYDLGREVYSRGRQGRRRELGISMMFILDPRPIGLVQNLSRRNIYKIPVPRSRNLQGQFHQKNKQISHTIQPR